MALKFGPRRGTYTDISRKMKGEGLSGEEKKVFEDFDLIYRSLCALAL